MIDIAGMRGKIIIAAVAFVATGIFVAMAPHKKESPPTIEGTIAQLDIATRRATLRFHHPKDGRPMDFTAVVPAECDIHLNGQPASLADLRVGDKVAVRALYGENGQEMKVLAVTAERTQAVESQERRQGSE